MLGTWRLLLALMVALTHVGVTIAGRDMGVTAVVCFYLISGYVMTGLIRTHYAGLPRARHFYADRFLRLWPHYLAVAGITLIWFWWTGSRPYFLAHAPRSFFPVLNGGDAAILYCFVFLYLVFAGAGPWSLDALRSRSVA